MTFRGFCWKKGKTILGLGMRPDLTEFKLGQGRQRICCLRSSEWMEKNAEELKRAIECNDPLQTDENIKN